MFIRLTLKRKIIIFAVASVIGIGILVYTGIENRRQNYSPNQSKSSIIKGVNNSSAQNANEEELAKQKQAEEDAKKKEEEEKKKQEQAQKEEQQKQLEQKYQEAYTDFHSKQYRLAINLSDEILKIDDSFYKAYSIKGIAQCYSNNYLEGMKNIDKALEIKSDYGYGLFNKALALELYAHYDEALQWYDKALSVENYIWSYYGKASIYGRRGDVANSVANLKIAIEMDNSVKDVARQEPDFNNVRNSKEFQDLIK